MAQLPAQCETCGSVGSVANLIGGSGSNITLSNVRAVGACRVCGGTMRVFDGVYDLTDDVVSAFRGLTRDDLYSMRDTLRQSKAGQVTPEAATEQVATISPEVAAIVSALQAQNRWNAADIVQVLLAVIALVLPFVMKPETTLTDADREALQRDVRQVIEQAQPTPRPVRAAPPAIKRTSPPSAKPTRKKRPPKTYGKAKKKRRR